MLFTRVCFDWWSSTIMFFSRHLLLSVVFNQSIAKQHCKRSLFEIVIASSEFSVYFGTREPYFFVKAEKSSFEHGSAQPSILIIQFSFEGKTTKHFFPFRCGSDSALYYTIEVHEVLHRLRALELDHFLDLCQRPWPANLLQQFYLSGSCKEQ